MNRKSIFGMLLVFGFLLLVMTVVFAGASGEGVISRSSGGVSGGGLMSERVSDESVNFSEEVGETSFIGMDIVNRSESSDTYSDGHGNFTSVIYAAAVNMKDLDGVYRPYEEVTEFSGDDDGLSLRWNDKSVMLKFYTKDKNGKKEKFSEKNKSKKDELKFRTNIKKQRGSYYFDHSLDKAKQPKKIGYDVVTENVDCVVDGYVLVCDEQRINFEQAVVEQGLSVEIGGDFVEFSGDDLSYIDPSVTRYLQDSLTAGSEYSGDWYDNEGSLFNIGSSDRDDDRISRGGLTFLVGDMNDDSIITGINAYLYASTIVMSDCGVSQAITIRKADEEGCDWTPNDDADIEGCYDEFGWGDPYAILLYDSDDDDQWMGASIDDGISELQSLVDGAPTDEFAIGLTGEENFGDDCYMNFQAEGSAHEPYITVTYHTPSPTSSHSATSPVGGSSYTSNTWTKDNVRHYISCGSECSYVQYCTGASCTPSGNYGVNEYVTISSESTTYFRWRGVYSGVSTYYGSTGQHIDKIDKTSPSTSATAISNGSAYTFGTVANLSAEVNLSCSDSYSGCSQTKYCIDTLNNCAPISIYSSSLNFSDDGTSYLRYYSVDNMGHNESVQSKTIIIDDLIPNVNFSVNGSLVGNLTDDINTYLSNCVADSEGYCDVPLEFSSDASGVVNVSNVSIYFNATEYLWNILGFDSGNYSVRIRAFNGVDYSDWNESEEFYIYEFVFPNDTNKFIIQNSSENMVAWLGDSGNILLQGTCSVSANCVAPVGSFIIANSTDNTTAYISPDGDMCVEQGDCSDLSALCNPSSDAFIVQNVSNVNMSYIDFDGNLCLTGRLYENVEF